MESQPQNPEFRNNPENLHPCIKLIFELQHDKSNNMIFAKIRFSSAPGQLGTQVMQWRIQRVFT